jgi:hypothetical protein
LEINSKAVAEIIEKYKQWKSSPEDIKALTQNERSVLTTYLNLYIPYSQWKGDDVSSNVQNLLLSSVTWWSQIIALELN